MTDEKPCPFCGCGDAALIESSAASYVQCGNCGARGPLWLTPSRAADAWEERAAVPVKDHSEGK